MKTGKNKNLYLKKHSRKQIQNTIFHWQCVFESLKAKGKTSNIIDALVDEFGRDVVECDELKYGFDDFDIFKLANMLNHVCFDDKLDISKLILKLADNNQENLDDLNKRQRNATTAFYYAIYVPVCSNDNESDFLAELLYINCETKKMTFMHIVNTICHELIHMYDAHYGNVLQLMKAGTISDEHSTSIFLNMMEKFNKLGLNIMKTLRMKDFDDINKYSVEKMKLIAENIDENTWSESSRELLRKFRNGTAPKNVCLGDDGSIAFIFAD